MSSGTVTAPKSNHVVKTALLCLAALLTALLYYPVLAGLFRQWLGDPNYTHGLLIPLVSAFFLFRDRETLRRTSGGGKEYLGLPLILLAAVLLVGGTAASELYTARLSLPIMLMGLILFLRGTAFAKRTAFPILFLLMMVPLPYIVYYKMTFPMQIMSAKLSAGILRILSVSIIRHGNILLLPGYTLEVVAACSGLRSLMTMVTLAMIFAAFSPLSPARRILLVLSALPVAIAANTIRLVVTALGAYTVGPEFADGPLHELSGLIVFLAGLLLLMLSAGVLKWIK